MPKHDKAPWRVADVPVDPEGLARAIVGEDGRPILWFAADLTDAELVTVARLAGAAPVMLKALREGLEVFGPVGPWADYHPEEGQETAALRAMYAAVTTAATDGRDSVSEDDITIAKLRRALNITKSSRNLWKALAEEYREILVEVEKVLSLPEKPWPLLEKVRAAINQEEEE